VIDERWLTYTTFQVFPAFPKPFHFATLWNLFAVPIFSQNSVAWPPEPLRSLIGSVALWDNVSRLEYTRLISTDYLTDIHFSDVMVAFSSVEKKSANNQIYSHLHFSVH
jgi:hypothetical protein